MSMHRVEFPTQLLWCCLLSSQVGFPTDNGRYIHVLEAAGEALTQVVQNVHHIPNEASLAENEEVDYWLYCPRCGKSRKVPKDYHDRNENSDAWHCGIEGSPVPLPEVGRCARFFSVCIIPVVLLLRAGTTAVGGVISRANMYPSYAVGACTHPLNSSVSRKNACAHRTYVENGSRFLWHTAC